MGGDTNIGGFVLASFQKKSSKVESAGSTEIGCEQLLLALGGGAEAHGPQR